MFQIVAAFIALCANAPSPEGLYLTTDGRRTVKIQCENGRCFGRVAKDDDHPDLVGRIVLRDLVPTGKNWKGTGVLPRKGKEFPVELSLPDSTTLRLNAKGGAFGRSRDWKRVR